MPSISRMNNGSISEQPARQYIAVTPFSAGFFQYTTTKTSPYTTVGNLMPFTNPENCPKGRILRENGRKLYPNTNPGVSVFMVGVYDNVTQLSGYIDPNSAYFTIFNTDRQYFVPDTAGDIGPSVYGTTVEAISSITCGTSLTAGWISSISSFSAGGDIVGASLTAQWISSISSLSVGGILNAANMQVGSISMNSIVANGPVQANASLQAGWISSVSSITAGGQLFGNSITSYTNINAGTSINAAQYITANSMTASGTVNAQAIVSYSSITGPKLLASTSIGYSSARETGLLANYNALTQVVNTANSITNAPSGLIGVSTVKLYANTPSTYQFMYYNPTLSPNDYILVNTFGGTYSYCANSYVSSQNWVQISFTNITYPASATALDKLMIQFYILKSN